MHPLFEKANALSAEVLSAAIEVQRYFGPGLLESIYAKCLARELNLRGHRTEREVPVAIRYKGFAFDEKLRVDLLVDGCLVVEVKAAIPSKEDMARFRAQTLSYLKLLDIPLGLVINFHQPGFGTRGISRVILKGAGSP